MRRPAIKRLRRLHGPLVLVGLLPKFLVPLGYMPAALANGGPLMLCDAYPLPAAVSHMQMGGPANPDSGTETAAADSADSGHGKAGEPGENPNHHSEWKRCSLGSLAALAAVSHDWRLAIDDGTGTAPGVAIPVIDTRTHLVAFRSRAPPVAGHPTSG